MDSAKVLWNMLVLKENGRGLSSVLDLGQAELTLKLIPPTLNPAFPPRRTHFTLIMWCAALYRPVPWSFRPGAWWPVS